MASKNIRHPLLGLNNGWGDSIKKVFYFCSCRHWRIALPFLVFMGVRVVTYTAHYKTRKVTHEPCCLYIKIEHALFGKRIAKIAFFTTWLQEATRPW